MAKLPAKKKPKNMTEGKLGQPAIAQKPIRIPAIKAKSDTKSSAKIRTVPSPDIAKPGSRTVTPKGMTQGKLESKRTIKEPRTKDDKVTPTTSKSKTTSKKTLSSFEAAFASARKAGKNEFTYRGKKYNTKVK